MEKKSENNFVPEIDTMKNKYIKSSIFLGALGMTTISAFAQTGPGGVSAIGTNTNLKLWLRADQQTYSNSGTTASTNGGAVQQWNDMSGNSRAAINTNGTTRPTWATGAVNGLPTVNFNGTTQTTTSAVDIRPAVMSNITVIAVAKSNVASGMGKIWGHDAPNQSVGFHRAVGMDTRAATTNMGYFAGTGVGSYGAVSQNAYFISTAAYTSTAFTGFINGAQTSSGAVTCNGGLTSISIGSITPSSEYWNGSISEFIIFDKILSSAERLMVENYLSAKYAIGMAAGTKLYTMDAPANGDYDFEVAGLISTSSGTVTNSQGSGIMNVSNPSNIGTNQSFMFGHDNGPLTLTGVNRPHAGLTSRLARTWRPSEIGDVGTMNVTFDVASIPGAPSNVSDYSLIIDRNNNGLFTDESIATGGVVPASSKSGNIVTFSGVNIADAQRFSMAFGNTVALPLDLISFGAAAVGTQNKIDWQTANVKGVAAMELERSTNGSDFSLMNRISVNETGHYAAIDELPAAITYYRLRIVDRDGSSSFGNIVKVLRQERSGTLRISPNPASDITRINGLPGTEATIRVFDMSGRQLQTLHTSSNSESVSLGAYPSGSYSISVEADGLHAVEQVVKR